MRFVVKLCGCILDKTAVIQTKTQIKDSQCKVYGAITFSRLCVFRGSAPCFIEMPVTVAPSQVDTSVRRHFTIAVNQFKFTSEKPRLITLLLASYFGDFVFSLYFRVQCFGISIRFITASLQILVVFVSNIMQSGVGYEAKSCFYSLSLNVQYVAHLQLILFRHFLNRPSIMPHCFDYD